MSRAWDLDRPELARHPGVRTAVDLIADAAEVDYMPTVNPDKPAEPMVTVSARLLGSVLADMMRDVDRARGERALLAARGSQAAQAGDYRETYWRALHPGYAEFMDWTRGVGL